MAANHPELGNITENEVRLIKEHREHQQRCSGWHQGIMAAINALDQFKWDDTSVTPERQREMFRYELKRIQSNPKV